ncbi:general amino acid permease [Seiridium cupressi]
MSASNYSEKGPPSTSTARKQDHSGGGDVDVGTSVITTAGSQALHRKLRGKEVQLFAIGGAIGTSLYVQMGSALPKGGPAGLFLAFVIWGSVMWAVNECFAEMVTYLPVPSPFIRFSGEWVDDALGFAMAWNFFLNMAFLVPFEIVALNIMITYWTDKVPVEAIIVAMIVLYAVLNVVTVRYFGVSEFYLSIFKVMLMIGLFFFTFITMVGGNPLHDIYGFRYWKDPGAFVEHLTPGNTGRFLGIISCMYQASFSICGPEYISMVAAETESPRKILPPAFRSFVWRILFFFVGSALCMGIVIPYNDSTLAAILGGEASGSGTGAASPYIIAMTREWYTILCDSRSPWNVTPGLCSKGLFQVHTGRRTDLRAFICSVFLSTGFPAVTCCQLLNYGFTAVTYRHYFAALKKQGLSRDTLPYKGRFQPYTSYFAMGGTLFMLLAAGYDLFLDGGWDVMWFFLTYGMIGFFIVVFIAWKVFHRTSYVRPGSADVSLGGLKEEIDDYEALYVAREPSKVSKWLRFE